MAVSPDRTRLRLSSLINEEITGNFSDSCPDSGRQRPKSASEFSVLGTNSLVDGTANSRNRISEFRNWYRDQTVHLKSERANRIGEGTAVRRIKSGRACDKNRHEIALKPRTHCESIDRNGLPPFVRRRVKRKPLIGPRRPRIRRSREFAPMGARWELVWCGARSPECN